MSNEIMDRLDDTPHIFRHVLDLGCHTGTLGLQLTNRPGIETVSASDISPEMVHIARQAGLDALVADEENLSFGGADFDLVASALSLHWVNDLPGALIQIRQILKPDGLFLGALLGAGTLGELRTSLMEAETELTGGVSARVSPLPGLQDMAALMQRAGFALPVVDVDHVKVRYSTPFDLLRDLGGMAERACFTNGGTRGLSPRILTRMAEIYTSRFGEADGKVPASFEIIHLSGWAPAPGQPQPKRRGSATISLADAIGSAESSKN